ncbi:MAG: hypothetical protein M3O70_09200 [Actinomycetota bacterium]|nr:hypothetical protein [Actinomycetota bacterium]
MAKLKDDEIAAAVLQAGWSPDDAPRAVAVVLAESGGDTQSDNPRSTAYGLFQILEGTARDVGAVAERVSPNPVDQARAGLKVLRKQGWCAWAVINCAPGRIDLGTGSYLKFMPRGTDAVAKAQGKPPGFYVNLGIPGVQEGGPSRVPGPLGDALARITSLIEGLGSGELLKRGLQIAGGFLIIVMAGNALISDLTAGTSPLGKVAKAGKRIGTAVPAGRAVKGASKAVKAVT